VISGSVTTASSPPAVAPRSPEGARPRGHVHRARAHLRVARV